MGDAAVLAGAARQRDRLEARLPGGLRRFCQAESFLLWWQLLCRELGQSLATLGPLKLLRFIGLLQRKRNVNKSTFIDPTMGETAAFQQQYTLRTKHSKDLRKKNRNGKIRIRMLISLFQTTVPIKGVPTFDRDAVTGGDTDGMSASGSSVTRISGTWMFGWRMRRDVDGDGFGSACCACSLSLRSVS